MLYEELLVGEVIVKKMSSFGCGPKREMSGRGKACE